MARQGLGPMGSRRSLSPHAEEDAGAAAHAMGSTEAAQEFLDWLSLNFNDDDAPAPLLVQAPPGQPRGVFAQKPYKQGDVILRVPLKLGLFESEAGDLVRAAAAASRGSPAEAEDLARLERKRHAWSAPVLRSAREQAGGIDSAIWTGKLAGALLGQMYGRNQMDHEITMSKHWEMWRKSLPVSIQLPPTDWTDVEVYSSEIRELTTEYEFVRKLNNKVFDAVALLTKLYDEISSDELAKLETLRDFPGRGVAGSPVDGAEAAEPGGVAWALNIVSSRAFDERDQGHYLAPGIDLFNHDYGEAACARLDAEIGTALHDPYHGQVTVVADRDIDAGEEIKFTYNRLPSEVLLIYYGFVPEQNPYDDVVLFTDLVEALEFVYGGYLSPGDRQKAISYVLDTASGDISMEGTMIAKKTEEDFHRLKISNEGVDGRLIQALQISRVMMDKEESVGELLVKRITQKLRDFSTTLEQDESELASVEAGSRKEAILRLRVSKKRILLMAKMAIQGALQAPKPPPQGAAKAKSSSKPSAEEEDEDYEEVFLD